MKKPIRIQRSRQHKMVSPNGLPIVYVGRPSKWGNPYKIKKSKWGLVYQDNYAFLKPVYYTLLKGGRPLEGSKVTLVEQEANKNTVYNKFINIKMISDMLSYIEIPEQERRMFDFYKRELWIEVAIALENLRKELKGKNLACWCKLTEKCHADILLKIANI